MKYHFPRIMHINDVLPHVKDHPDFIVAERDFGFVINYNVQTSDTFRPINSELSTPEAEIVKRECRGLIFDKAGKLISRPFHKFFNVGEREETLVGSFDYHQPHMLVEKLDGSMIRPILVKSHVSYHDDYLRLCTKMGITEVAMQAEYWMADKPNYKEFMLNCLQADMTPIFEWCSRQNRVVIDHPVDRLILLAIRDNYDGRYVQRANLEHVAASYQIDLVRAYDSTEFRTLPDLVDFVSKQSDGEGIVLTFADGHMVKIKSDQYVALHKLRDNILREKNVINLILTDQVDDIRGKMTPEDRDAVEAFEREFIKGVQEKSRLLAEKAQEWFAMSRKDFALEVAPTLGILSAVMFKSWGKPEEVEINLKNLLENKTKTQGDIDSIRSMWGGAKYVPAGYVDP